MKNTIEGIASCIVYIDDLLTHTGTNDKHIVELDKVMARLEDNGLKINLEKSLH